MRNCAAMRIASSVSAWRRRCGLAAGATFSARRPASWTAWNEIDIHQRIQAMTELTVEFAKDTSAACAAELVVGQGRALRNFLYLFIGTFIGGGLVIDGHLHPGPRAMPARSARYRLAQVDDARADPTLAQGLRHSCWSKPLKMRARPASQRTTSARCRRICAR